MMRMRWKQLAFGLVAATLSLGVAACDDDTGNSTDMAVSNDMSAAAGDMAMATPGNAQVTLADIYGTAYQGNAPIPRLHTLKAIASFSKFAGTPDPSSNFTLGPPPTGCSIYRYDIGAGKVPGSDADAGPVTMTGYDTSMHGTDTATGITAKPLSTITCVRGGPLMTYSCFYGSMPDLTDGGSAGMGALADDVIYAPLGNPLNNNMPFAAADQATAQGMCNAFTFTGTTAIQVNASPALWMCEQHPIANGGVAQIVEDVMGGADYTAPVPTSTVKIGNGGLMDGGVADFPDAPTIVSVKSGGTDITGANPLLGPLDLADSSVDVNKDLTITWSCDGTATAGSGCTGTTDFLGVLIQTSTNKKGTFSTPQVTKFGVGQCVELVAKTSMPAFTATVTSAQLKALVGGDTGGSMQIAVVRLGIGIRASGAHTVVYTAGHGQFGFTNLP